MSSARRVVFDTSTLIGALLVPDSAPQRALTLARQWYELCGSAATLAEFESVILRAKFDRYQDRATRQAFAALIRKHTQVFAIPDLAEERLPKPCRDPRDNKFLALALACEADFIVSSDADLISLNPYEGIAVINAVEFLAVVKQPARKGEPR